MRVFLPLLYIVFLFSCAPSKPVPVKVLPRQVVSKPIAPPSIIYKGKIALEDNQYVEIIQDTRRTKAYFTTKYGDRMEGCTPIPLGPGYFKVINYMEGPVTNFYYLKFLNPSTMILVQP